MEHVKIDKSKEKIESMFDEIAPTYDRLNHLFTFNIDTKWRREIVKYITDKNIAAGQILDVASGTGDLTMELLRLNPVKISSVDLSAKMLKIQRDKIPDKRLELIQSDVSCLPFGDDTFDIVTIGFGVRNFENLNESLKEIKRVMKPGGKLIVLEMFKTYGIRTDLFNLYFGKVMPFFGNRISKSKYAYSYLFKSVDKFLSAAEFISDCQRIGFELEYKKNNFIGIVNTVYLTKHTAGSAF
ncbi:MAG: ubiquinone/menaquinone biosynthesis methyltransferase [Ignavibacteria bacterium]|nr:ubiquinone/menaquinone biosynthesis methyltransferase [Ignavibacteria bacterium]